MSDHPVPAHSEPAIPAVPAVSEPSTAADLSTVTGLSTVTEPSTVTEGAKPRSPAIYVAYGVSGAIFLLYAIGWAITLLVGPSDVPDGVLAQIMAYLTIGLAIASGPLWFMGVFLLTRGRRPIIQVLWQLLGIALLAPWPFILGV